MATQKEINDLQAEIDRLKSALDVSEKSREESKDMAHAMAQATPYIGAYDDQPTGKTVMSKVCLNPTAKPDNQKFKEVEVPTYYYTIDLPPGAGNSLSTNGIEYYHGQVYEFDAAMLAEMKSRVARCYDHEKSIHGGNENSYRKQTKQSFISSAALQRGLH